MSMDSSVENLASAGAQQVFARALPYGKEGCWGISQFSASVSSRLSWTQIPEFEVGRGLLVGLCRKTGWYFVWIREGGALESWTFCLHRLGPCGDFDEAASQFDEQD